MELIYSSRSKLESFLDCPRLGYIRYLWNGRGLRKRAASVYLSTGTYTHIGLELLFLYAKHFNRPPNSWDEVIDDAVKTSLGKYYQEIKDRGFDLEEGEDRANEQYIIAEQCALVEAFIRSFAIRVLPDLLSRFKIIDVEREEQVVNGNVVMEGRIDVIMEEISTGDWYIDSFKTAANWDRRQEKANEHDNQGLSETWILEDRLRHENIVIDKISEGVEIIHGLEGFDISSSIITSLDPRITIAAKKFKEYVGKFRKPTKIMGVIMIYMLKGKRYETQKGSGRWEQHCPLIRAYRKLVGTEYEYASSMWYDKPENKSGKGRLGKGWEPFTVWDCEEVGGVKGWIDKLANNQIGGEDVIGNSFKIPAPYFRNQDHIDSWVRQSFALETDIKRNLEILATHKDMIAGLDVTFPQRRKGCHYPVDCEMLDICYNREIFDDPIGSGKFVYRKPHHKGEMAQHDALYQIVSEGKQISKNGKEESKEIGRGDIRTNEQNKGMERGASEEVDILDQEVIIDE